jgi:hypothetical protein
MTDHRLHAPATLRNRDPILEVLRIILPKSGLALEIASGSGEHIVHFAAHLPNLTFQPSDPDPDALRSIEAWTEETGVKNVRPPILLDATQDSWPISAAGAVLCINMIHIAPWHATLSLLDHAAAILPPDAPLYLYGPYRRENMPWADSNQAFDQSLKARNPDWGVRQLEKVTQLAGQHGFGLPDITQMPANNLSVTFYRHAAPHHCSLNAAVE